ncbi:MAG: hypothetical protein U0232_00900 [Thermomicrobiales bacterium]
MNVQRLRGAAGEIGHLAPEAVSAGGALGIHERAAHGPRAWQAANAGRRASAPGRRRAARWAVTQALAWRSLAMTSAARNAPRCSTACEVGDADGLGGDARSRLP